MTAGQRESSCRTRDGWRLPAFEMSSSPRGPGCWGFDSPLLWSSKESQQGSPESIALKRAVGMKLGVSVKK